MENYDNNQGYNYQQQYTNPQGTNPFTEYYALTQQRPYIPNKNVFRIAALLSYIIGYIYIRFVCAPLSWDYDIEKHIVGLPFLIFGLIFILGCELFAHFTGCTYEDLRKRGCSTVEAAIFAVCVVLQSIALFLWGFRSDVVAMLFQLFMWHCTIIYYVLARCGKLTAGKSGILFPMDCFQGSILVPFGNLLFRTETISRRGDMKDDPADGKKPLRAKITVRSVLLVALSVFIAAIVCLFAIKELGTVSDTFDNLSNTLYRDLGNLFGDDLGEWIWDNLIKLLFSIPVSCYLYGLVAGSLKKKAPEITEDTFNRCTRRFHQLPAYSAYIIIGSVSLLYLIFFGTALYDFINNQGLFAATAHEASTRAVSSFWSLIRVILLNFAIMFGSCLFSAEALWAKKGTRIIATILFVFALGFALFGLYNLCVVYMGAYGFTAKRVLSTWVEGNIIVWCLLMIARLYKKIPAAQIGIILGALSFSIVMLAKF